MTRNLVANLAQVLLGQMTCKGRGIIAFVE